MIGELAAPTAWSETTKIPREAEEIPRTFAFYLPQFHPIAENNWAHGMGFTEWHNVVNARPLFKGHYQPRIPGELGYYDLRAEETLHQQVNLALEYGLTGFCFYYYYFQGRKLLFNPIKNYVQSDLKAPFFFLWANENWSKRWDGGDQEVIISQQHGRQDDLAFIRELAQLFADDRYVKVAGKPVLHDLQNSSFPGRSQHGRDLARGDSKARLPRHLSSHGGRLDFGSHSSARSRLRCKLRDPVEPRT